VLCWVNPILCINAWDDLLDDTNVVTLTLFGCREAILLRRRAFGNWRFYQTQKYCRCTSLSNIDTSWYCISVYKVCQFLLASPSLHWSAGTRILSYVKVSIGLVLKFKKDKSISTKWYPARCCEKFWTKFKMKCESTNTKAIAWQHLFLNNITYESCYFVVWIILKWLIRHALKLREFYGVLLTNKCY
jgi:hypothetical protein